jgi:hypothetical protein
MLVICVFFSLGVWRETIVGFIEYLLLGDCNPDFMLVYFYNFYAEYTSLVFCIIKILIKIMETTAALTNNHFKTSGVSTVKLTHLD